MTDEISELKKEIELLKKKLENRGETQKKGMIARASKGNVVSRIAFGYAMENGKLVPAGNFREVEEIFEEFLKGEMSLRKISAKHKFSVNGLKKILKNFTYIGKVKFNNQIYNGNPEPIISSTLFNHVQNKLEEMG